MTIVLAKILLYENQPHMRRAHHTAHSTPRARRSAGHRLSIRPHGGMCRAGVLCGAEVKQVSRVHRRPPPGAGRARGPRVSQSQRARSAPAAQVGERGSRRVQRPARSCSCGDGEKKTITHTTNTCSLV
jgi:hypothetical protein